MKITCTLCAQYTNSKFNMMYRSTESSHCTLYHAPSSQNERTHPWQPSW